MGGLHGRKNQLATQGGIADLLHMYHRFEMFGRAKKTVGTPQNSVYIQVVQCGCANPVFSLCTEMPE